MRRAADNFLDVEPDAVRQVDLFATGSLCNRYSPAVSGKKHAKGLDDPTTRRLHERLCEVVAKRPAKLLLFENVAHYFGTPAFDELKRTALAAGCAAWPSCSCAPVRAHRPLRARVGRRRYKLVDLVKLNALDVGLWQSRQRTFALFALEAPKYDFKHLVAQLCASEKTRAIPLEQCLVDDTDRAQLEEYGISDDDLAARKVLTGKQAASLQTALGRLEAALGRLDPPVSLDDASKEWIFCDTRKSDKFAGATLGHAPTLTASSRSVWCTRLGRHLHPIEHGLLQGWQDDQIKARASARPRRADRHPNAVSWRQAAVKAFPGADAWKIAALAGASPGRRRADPIDATASARSFTCDCDTQGGRSRWSSTSSCCARSPCATPPCSTCTSAGRRTNRRSARVAAAAAAGR